MTTDNYNPSTSLSPYFRGRANKRADARIWAIEKALHDLAALGVLAFFEGPPGSDPTQLPGYASNKIWLQQSAGVQTAPGTAHFWNGSSPASDPDNWPEITPNDVPLSVTQAVEAAADAETAATEAAQSATNAEASADAAAISANVLAAIEPLPTGLVFATWATLAADVDSSHLVNGQVACVLASDTGTHTDPITSATVLNSGIFKYVTGSPAGWQRVGEFNYQINSVARSRHTARVPLIVFAGESNSGGLALNSDATLAELQKRPEVKIWDNYRSQFDELHIGVNAQLDHDEITDNSWHGWELQLANQVAAGTWNFEEVYLVKAGQGGSKVAEWGASSLYFRKWCERVVAAMAAMRAVGKEPILIMFYSNGINDSVGGTSTSDFTTGVQSLFARFRQVVGQVFPIIMTKLPPGFTTYDTALETIASTTPMVWTASATAANSYLRDSHHWSYAGMKLLADALTEQALIATNAQSGLRRSLCAFDRSNKFGGISLSDSERRAVGTSLYSHQTALGALGRASGKHYFEIYINSAGGSGNPNCLVFGIAQRNILLASTDPNAVILGTNGTSAGVQVNSGASNRSNTTAGSALTTTPTGVAGHYNQVAVDFDAGKVWIGVDGVWNGAPASGTGAWTTFTPGTTHWYPAVSVYFDCDVTLRSLASEFSGSIPSGFSAWGASASITAPVNRVAPYLYGTAKVGAEMFCAPGRWDGASPTTFSYQWRRSGVDIGGATDRFYRPVVDDVGLSISCVVTALNIAGGEAAASAGATVLAESAASTWNTLAADTALVFSNGNLDVSGASGATRSVRGTNGKEAGKHYFELEVVTGSDGSSFLGISDELSVPTEMRTAQVKNSASKVTSGSGAGSGFTRTATALGTTVTGRVIGVHVDVDAKKAWLSNNNVLSEGDPAAGTTPSVTWTGAYRIFPFCAISSDPSTKIRLVTSGCHYTPATGFSEWDA